MIIMILIVISFISFPLTVPVLVRAINRSHNLRTVIVTADIHQGLYSQSSVLRHLTTIFDLLALVRHHPLYILLRVRRELCF